MIPATTGGLDREQMRQVFMSIGKPVPRRAHALTDLMGAVRLVGLRPLMLIVLLGLVILFALTGPAAWGAEAAREPVQKAQGGVGEASDIPLREIENFSGVGGPTLYNFLQISLKPAIPLRPAPGPDLTLRERKADDPTRLLTALALIALIILWLHLRATRLPEPTRPKRKVRR